jgi:uncharacterized protein YcnI
MQSGWKAMAWAAGMTLLVSAKAQAHISATSPATANSTQEITFGVGHGCGVVDTFQIEVQIPAGVSNVRPLHGGVFGNPKLVKDEATGVLKSIRWTKNVADVADGDPNYYKLAIRAKLPDAPFTTLYFKTTQTCRDASGVETTEEWFAEGESEGHSETGPAPSPAVYLLPARTAGWNKFVVTQAIKDLSVFNDAQIVWADNKAYSANAVTKAFIESEPGTQLLTEIPANTEIWVKY